MSVWQSELDIRDIWQKSRDHELTIQELSTEMVVRLKKVVAKSFDSDIIWVRDEIIEELEHVSECDSDDDTLQSWFNMAMSRLYDWGDSVVKSTPPVSFSQTKKYVGLEPISKYYEYNNRTIQVLQR